MVDLGDKLKTLRMEKNLTQLQVAERIGTTKATISACELSTRQPSFEVLIKLAAFFNVTTDYLLGLQKQRSLNVDGLTDKQISLLSELVESIKHKNTFQ